MRAADWRSQPMQSMLQRTVFSKQHAAIGEPGFGAGEDLPVQVALGGARGSLRADRRRGLRLAVGSVRQPGDRSGLGFWHPLQIPASSTGHNGQLPLGQILPETLRHGAEEHLRESILVQIAQMAGAVVVLATARDREVAVNGEVVFGLAAERAAIESLPSEPGGPLQPIPHDLADKVADYPIKSSALHSGQGFRSLPTAEGKP